MSTLVTGGTKGIGLAIALRLAKPGEELFLVYHQDEAAAADAKAQLEKAGATIHLEKSDVGSVDDVASLMKDIQATAGGLDHIVHAAAMIYPTRLLDADLETFSKSIEVNGLSLLYLVRGALPLLGEGSSIVFISSLGAHATTPGSRYAALGIGKALAESIILYLVPELAPLGIRINAVAPGLVHTTSVAKMVGSEETAAKLVQRAAQMNPSGRAIRDEEYTSLVEYLLSPDAQFIQGQVIAATGGAGLVR